ncbi:AMP-binding protein [Paremcibacter congregatus]|uniref:3-methylmercaptopropionyl-CoA ligase n=1 Tax=Paremcibacter congregatus TaxID=2043170 RepID=A0A2G4YMN2_9PROT|nr:AMP-binding protein [Paremcibacter congregatus]PHZ83582.1 AMP-binding protein [Paremcibacter congregatus]QDE28331.1 AMP-binding protein [Paremcibacter congregatus]
MTAEVSEGPPLSIVTGDKDAALITQTIGDRFDQAVKVYGDRNCVVVCDQGVRWTYSEFAGKVTDFAAGLLSLGLVPGDRVGIWAPNCAEWLITQYATAKAGLIQVNINPAYGQAELEYALNKVGCKALITAEQFKNSAYITMLQTLAPELNRSAPGNLQAAKLPALKTVIRLGDAQTPGFFNFDAIMARADDDLRTQVKVVQTGLRPHDAINIQFTSGTTGAPKGATLTHHNILNNGYFVGQAMKFTEQDRLCIPVPLYHCFGMVMGSLTCITHGACMVLPGEGFDPAQTLKAVMDEKCTALHGVPTMFIAELDLPDLNSYDLSSLRTGIMAGASCPIKVMKRVFTEMHMTEVTIAYGMTETSPVSFQSSTDDPIEHRVSTVGRIHPHVEVKVIDEAGNITPRGVRGELCTRGYSVMQGYWADPERTAEAIDAEGWMHTGDLATLDEAGYCNIVGRVKDMVIRGGENIYPREVEEYFYRHPKIQDAQVFGVPDERFGEELCIWVRLKDGEQATEDEMRTFCRGQIAHYKIPRYVVFVEDFPMTVTGKIQKFKMREHMMATLGLTEIKTA